MTIIGDFLSVTSCNLVYNRISQDTWRVSLIKPPTLCPARGKTLNTSFLWLFIKLNVATHWLPNKTHKCTILHKALKNLVLETCQNTGIHPSILPVLHLVLHCLGSAFVDFALFQYVDSQHLFQLSHFLAFFCVY